jgi:uncharacterized RDD family membrane protein YckC
MAAETAIGIGVADAPKGGFWIRVLAAIIDGILLGIAGGILRGIFGDGAGGGLSTLVSIVYLIYFWTTTGQTIGHRVLNLRVVKSDGSKLSVTDGIIRYVGEIISAIPLGLGFMWAGWDSKKQGWHDKMAHTYVIRT